MIPVDKPIIDFHGNKIHKTVYCLVFQDGPLIREKLTKICQSFMGQTIDVQSWQIEEALTDIGNKIQETKRLILFTQEKLKEYLEVYNKLNQGPQYDALSAILLRLWYIRKEKCLYNELNKLKASTSLLHGLFWCPKEDPNLKDLNQFFLEQ